MIPLRSPTPNDQDALITPLYPPTNSREIIRKERNEFRKSFSESILLAFYSVRMTCFFHCFLKLSYLFIFISSSFLSLYQVVFFLQHNRPNKSRLNCPELKVLGQQNHSLTVLKEAVDLDLSIFNKECDPVHFYVFKLFLLSYPINQFEPQPYPNNVENIFTESSPLKQKLKPVPRKLKNHNDITSYDDNFFEILDTDVFDVFDMSPNDRGSMSLIQSTNDVISPYDDKFQRKPPHSSDSKNAILQDIPSSPSRYQKNMSMSSAQHLTYYNLQNENMSMSSAQHLTNCNRKTSPNKNDLNVMNTFEFPQEPQYVSYLIIICIFCL
jgi:hypothetical protein